MGYKINIEGWTGYRGDMNFGETFYEKWKDNEVIYHVAPMLNADAHRRWIGNDIVLVIFLEEGAVFDPSDVDHFGQVPQVFVVIQPENGQFKANVLSRVQMRQCQPEPTIGLLSKSEVKEWLLTKGTLIFLRKKLM